MSVWSRGKLGRSERARKRVAGWRVGAGLGATLALGLVAGLGTLAAPSAAVAASESRYAVLVGNNLGNDRARALRYAEDDVARLAGLLKRSGDFQDVLLIRGGTTESVQNAFQQMQAHILADKSAGRGTMFFFYYSGHGDNEALELGGSRLPLRYLREHLEGIAADVRVAFVDACHSGAMNGVKGAHRAPGYEVRLADPGRVRGLAIITSSTGHEYSQESEDLKASFFSHSVLSGLLGAADSSGDGQVTLGELYQYAFRRTLSATAASLTGGQHPTYDYRMVGTGDVVLARLRQDDAKLVFPSGSVATYVIMGRDEVVAEVPSSMDSEQYVALPSGSYQVLRRSLEGVYGSTIKIAPGASVKVDPSSMVAVQNQRTIALMGRFDGQGPGVGGATDGVSERALPSAGARATAGHRVAGTAALEASPWPGVGAAAAWGLAYRYDFASGWTAGLGATLGRSEANDAGYRSTLWQANVDAVLLRNLLSRRSWAVGLGAFGGVPWVKQTDTLGVSSSGAGLAAGAALEASFRVAGPWWVGAAARGGAVAARVDSASKWRPLVSGNLFVGLSF